jgi:hypothetical protein
MIFLLSILLLQIMRIPNIPGHKKSQIPDPLGIKNLGCGSEIRAGLLEQSAFLQGNFT